MRKKKSFSLIALGGICVMIIAAVAAYGYSSALDATISKSVFQTLSELTVQQKFNLHEQIESDLNQVTNLATVMGRSRYSHQENIDLITQMVPNTNFDTLFLSDLQGDAVTLEGQSVNLADREHFQLALQGQVVIGNPITSKVRDIIITPVAAPIYDQEDKIVGVVVGSYTVDKLQELLLPCFDGKGTTYVLDKTGELIITTSDYRQDERKSAVNVMDGFDSIEVFQVGSKQQMLDDMQNGASGYIVFEVNGQARYGHYMPIGINDWYIVTSVNRSVAFEDFEQVQMSTLRFGAILLLVLALVVALFVYMLRYNYKQLKLEHNDLNLAIKLSERSLIRYHPQNDQAELFGHFAKIFGEQKLLPDLTARLLDKKVIQKQSLETFTELITALQSGEPRGTAELAVKFYDDQAQWIKVEYITVYDEKGETSHQLINVFDYTQQHSEEEKLKSAARIDPLTGLLNRTAMEEVVTKTIATVGADEHIAVLLVDLDDFKHLNDDYGHLAGDDALIAIAKTLAETFYGHAEIGRMGGDEFMIVVSPCTKKWVLERADLINRHLAEVNQVEGLSVSIGISFATGNQKPFEELYKQADFAMYHAKKSGKKNYAVWSDRAVN